MNRPLVSVIIPAYNSEKYIQETIASVLSQTFADFELLVIDDGSIDSQQEKIFEFCKRDARVRYIRQENQGVSAARNHGYNLSSGSLIAFLDADDVWLPSNLSLKVSKILDEGFDFVHSDAVTMDSQSNTLERRMQGSEGWLLNKILLWEDTQIPGPSSLLVKRSVLNSVGIFDTQLSTSADHDFFIRVAAKVRIGRVSEVTWRYRLHDQNMHKNIRLMEKDVLFLYRKASLQRVFESSWFEGICYTNMYLILAASWAGDGKNKIRAAYFIMLAILSHPFAFVNIFNRVRRKWFSKSGLN